MSASGEVPYAGAFKPNRELLNVNFHGYKLSENPLNHIQENLPCPTSRVHLRGDDFSYQHVRAYTLHNHLHFDPSSPSSVYWAASDGSIRKATLTGTSVRYETVLRLRTEMERPANVTMEFLGGRVGVVCLGGSEILVFNRTVQNDIEEWDVLKSLVVSEDRPVILVTASLGVTGTHADVLCAEISNSLSPGDSDVGVAMGVATYKWVRVHFKVNPMLRLPVRDDIKDMRVVWGLNSKSLALYATFQHHPSSGEAQLLFISETTPLIDTPDPEEGHPTTATTTTTPSSTSQDEHLFSEPRQHCGLGYQRDHHEWTQSETDVVVSFTLDPDVGKRDISCILETNEVVVGLTDGTTLLQGEPTHSIDPEASTWAFQSNVLEVTLEKAVEGVTWPHLLKDPEIAERRSHWPLSEGIEDELSPEELQKAKHLLAGLMGPDEVENSPSKRACPMVQNMLEECDSSDEDSVLFVISQDCTIQERVGLGGRQLVFTCSSPSPSGHPGYMCLRHDVDGVVWLPHACLTNSHSRWSHVSTFHALGYVQASKRDKKFTTCPPNLKFAVITDSSRHVFVYMQPEEEELNSAETYVYSAAKSADLLGIVACDNGTIFVLTQEKLDILKIPNI